MRRRKLSDEERAALSFNQAAPVERQPLLFNKDKATWPVVHPELVKPPAPITPRTGPVSDETGGHLNAREAYRVTGGLSIRFAGHLYEKGCILCREHVDPDGKVIHRSQGYRMTIYCGTPSDHLIGECVECGAQVFGEDPSK